ncbi:hypothetical protein CVO77_00310 [Sphingopyxis lindanitolerans]|uniref:Uncharacterized protein n=1 Tax=Sphingopyxis lindanitolerans TaxID=2054227 RepID=A0A2S8BAQ7_9SPHN|nr:hypothetical protein CVO77_00310 [Sphingopyxis lindanitolerans]
MLRPQRGFIARWTRSFSFYLFSILLSLLHLRINFSQKGKCSDFSAVHFSFWRFRFRLRGNFLFRMSCKFKSFIRRRVNIVRILRSLEFREVADGAEAFSIDFIGHDLARAREFVEQRGYFDAVGGEDTHLQRERFPLEDAFIVSLYP